MALSYPAHRPGAGNGLPAGRRIVVGVDGSGASVAALTWAAREARLRRAELAAVYAWEDTEQLRAPYADRHGVTSRAEARAAAASLLSASVRAVFGQTPPPGLRAEVADGRPEQVLPGLAAGSEMLVLGCTRRTSDYQAALGPVHRACLHSAPCPVAIVGCLPVPAHGRQDPRQPTAEGRILGAPRCFRGWPALPGSGTGNAGRALPPSRPGHDKSGPHPACAPLAAIRPGHHHDRAPGPPRV
jgi:nucleotide-binding universal stress UspA family protein